MIWSVERRWDGGEWVCVTFGSEATCRATMAQCAPRWRRENYSVRLVPPASV